MRTVDCPACGLGFVQRGTGHRCPRCRALLVHLGDIWNRNEPAERVYLWTGDKWAQVTC